jgi:hypothetical protein
MASSSPRRFLQFRLRTLLLVLTVFSLGYGAFLWWWRTPFLVERVTTTPSTWDPFSWVKRTAFPSGTTFREQARVYRDLQGNLINLDGGRFGITTDP